MGPLEAWLDILTAMNLLDMTLPTPAENLALDEALLEAAENGAGGQTLRFWESDRVFAVLGYSRKASEDLDLEACRRDGIPVLRRASGGGTVLQGPGCLNFALVLKLDAAPELRTIQGTNAWVLSRIASALRTEVPGAAHRGVSDLAVDGKKFSGTAQRRKRTYALFHGTLLHALDLGAIEKYIAHPPDRDQPDYRDDRKHGDFLTALSVPPTRLKELIRSKWAVAGPLEAIPLQIASELVRSRYSLADWNLKY